MKNKVILTLTVLCLCAGVAFASGNTNAAEVLVGAKNQGAPSQQLAGRMHLMMQGLREVRGECFNGTVKNPSALIKHGFTDVSAGDPVQLEKTGDMLYRITLPKGGQSKLFLVRFKD